MGHHGHHLPKPTFLFILLLSVLLVLIEAQNTNTDRNNVTDVKVGVILDTSTWTGGSSWSCMQLALDDFYALYPNYTTRISLVLRDLKSDGGVDGPDHHDDETDADAFGAAVAALDLLKNVRVHAIIGPQTSSQVKFIVGLGNKSNVPVISFSAKFPSTSFSQTPYFYRTSWNDSSQATVIASIVQFFKWKEVVPVYEDNESGNMFVPYLVDTLQEKDAHVLYRCKIPSLASESEINATLDYMNANRTRVFVVHMSKKLALRFFTIANAKNMLTEEYVWITMYGLTDIVDILGSNASNVMQGVLGIRPLVPENTSRFDNVSVRLRNIFKVNSRPTVFDLWAYDTVWLLAKSVEHVKDRNLSFKLASNSPYNSTDFSKIGVSVMGPELKDSIENTNFSGISGDFKLVNGQLKSGRYEITNVIGRNNTRVGIWNGDKNLFINWPGNNRTAPKGWQWPVTGGTLVIGVPSKPGFREFITRNSSASQNFSGYSIEVFQAAIDQLPYNVKYRFEEYTDPKTNEPKGDYDELVYQVYLKKYDAVVGDITILANRSLYVDFTLPYTESGVRLLVPIRDVNKKSPWAFLKPWTAKLWITAGGFFLLTGITVWFVEHRVNEEFRGDPSNQVGSIFYFAFSTLVFAHKEKLVSNLSRVVVITWVFVVLILQQSYTASLSSTLTVEQLQATVTSIEQVIKAGQRVGYLDDSFMPGLLKRLGVNESKMISLSSSDTYNEALSNGTVAAVVDEIPYLKVFLKKYHDNYTMVGPTYKTDGFGFAFPKGSPLVADISRAVLNVTESSNMTKFDEILYGNRTFTDKEDTTSSTSLTFRSFMGLFLLTGATSILALIIHMILSIYEKHNRTTSIEAVQNQPRNDGPREENRLHEHTTPPQDFGDIVEINIMSTDSESEFEEMTSFEGTPGREITNSEIEMPSFGDVLNHPDEEPHE